MNYWYIAIVMLISLSVFVEYRIRTDRTDLEGDRPVIGILIVICTIAWPLVILYLVPATVGFITGRIITYCRKGGDQ